MRLAREDEPSWTYTLPEAKVESGKVGPPPQPREAVPPTAVVEGEGVNRRGGNRTSIQR